MSSAIADIGRGPARQLARRELARPIYRPSLVSRVWNDITSWLDSLFASRSGGTNWLAVAVLAVLVVAAGWGVAYWLGRPGRRRGHGGAGVLGSAARTAADYRREAAQRAAAADWRQAIAEQVRAIAADLEARQVLPSRADRTADELAAEAAGAFPAQAAALAAAARLFDDVRYGDRPGSKDGYESVRALDARLAGATPRTGAASAPAPAGSPA